MTTFYTKATMDIRDLRGHPGQPPSRTLDTTELQESILDIGLQHRIRVVLVEEGKYAVVEGHRRVAALKALGLKGHDLYHQEVEIMSYAVNDTDAWKALWQGNIQSPASKSEVLYTVRQYVREKKVRGADAIYKAAKTMGVPASIASLLNKLDAYDKKLDGRLVQALIANERGHGGMSWTAWRNGAAQSVDWWKARLDGDKALTATAVADARAKARDQARQIEAIEDIDLEDITTAMPAVLAALGRMHKALRNGVTAEQKDDIRVAFEPVEVITGKIREKIDAKGGK